MVVVVGGSSSSCSSGSSSAVVVILVVVVGGSSSSSSGGGISCHSCRCFIVFRYCSGSSKISISTITSIRYYSYRE